MLGWGELAKFSGQLSCLAPVAGTRRCAVRRMGKFSGRLARFAPVAGTRRCAVRRLAKFSGQLSCFAPVAGTRRCAARRMGKFSGRLARFAPVAGTRRCAARRMGKFSGRLVCFAWLVSGLSGLLGCGHAFPVAATFRGDASANVVADATLKGSFDVKLPSAVDPGEMTATVVRAGQVAGGVCADRVDRRGRAAAQPEFRQYLRRGRQSAGGVPRQAGGGRPRYGSRGGCAADQQPRRQRHDLRHHGRRASPVPRRDTQACGCLFDGPRHLRRVLHRRRERPDRRSSDSLDRRPRASCSIISIFRTPWLSSTWFPTP